MYETNSIFVASKERIAKNCVCCGSSELKKSPAVLMPFVANRVFGWEPVEITEEWGLRTLKNGMVYSICNSIQCSNCGLLFLDIRFNENEMNALYDGYRNEQYVDLREKYEPGYKNRNDNLNTGISYLPVIENFLAPHLKFPISILDWGGDTGRNTPFKNRNRFFHVYDISNKPVIEGAKKINKLSTRQHSYDLIVCSNVLEHVPYPIEIVLDIKKSMSSDTLLYIEVPYEDLVRLYSEETDLYIRKKHWHEHINFYTEKSLVKMLSACGLSILDLKKLEVNHENKSTYLFFVACKLL